MTGFLHDERGAKSTARALLWLVVLFTLAIIAADAAKEAVDVPGEAYVVLTTLITGLIAWAAGPRVAQQLSPMFGKALEGVAGVVKAKNARRDAELGIEVTK